LRNLENKIIHRKDLSMVVHQLRSASKTIVTTNGAFDMFHYGHLKTLVFARRKGDALIVGINSDASIKKYKSEKRPVISEFERSSIVAAMECVDYVSIFNEETPEEFLEIIKPDFHVKGSEYKNNIIEKTVVEQNNGKIIFMDRDNEDVSTSGIIQKLLSLYG